MKLSPRQKKWLKRIGILLIIRFVVGGLFYYIIVYRFEDVLRVAVNRESKGLYSFDAENIDVSLFTRNIIMEKVRLRCNDTLHSANYYAIEIPRIYLSIESFRELVFHKNLSVDSMAILSPFVSAHIHTSEKTETTELSLQASDFMQVIQKLLLHLQIRTLRINEASFAYYENSPARPFTGSHVNFTVSNLSKKGKTRAYLFSADDIDLLITGQHWQLPDSIHELSFSRLHFSGKSQKFEIDSCMFESRGVQSENTLQLNADRIFFNSKSLQDIYEKEELSIDTISFFHPVLAVQSRNSTTNDTAAAINSAMQNLFKKMTFKYVDITDGQIRVGGRGGMQNNYRTEKTNLQAYNLAVIPGGKPGLTVDSINLKLSSINFFTRDSMNQLSIGEFALNRNRLVLLKAKYGPTSINHRASALRFATPVLEIEDVSIEELIQERLVGTVARLDQPVINVSGRDRKADQAKSPRGMKDFFTTLHNLQELIEVDSFRIINGSLNYHVADKKLQASLRGLNATVLINRFLRSDSLIDIKRSLPNLSVDQVLVNAPDFKLQIDDYEFFGNVRYNESAGFSINTGGVNLEAIGVNWKIFDWDLFANHKIIQIQELYADKLIAKIDQSNKPSTKEKPLPVIHVARFDLGQFDLDLQTRKDEQFRLIGNNICLDEINSDNQFLTWNNLLGQADNLRLRGPNTSFDAGSVALDNNYGFSFKQSSLRSQKAHLNINLPAVFLKMPLHSTDFSRPHIHEILLDDPLISVQIDTTTKEPRETFELPFSAKADEISIRNGLLRFKNERISAETKLNMQLHDVDIKTSGAEMLTYADANFQLSSAQFQKANASAGADSIKLHFTNGMLNGATGLSTAVLANWSGAFAHFQKADTSSTSTNIFDITGNFENRLIKLGPAEKQDWKKLMAGTTIEQGTVKIATKNLIAGARSLRWNGTAGSLHAGDFYLSPNRTLEESLKPGSWQSDYLTVKGKSVDLTGLRFNAGAGDSLLHADRIAVSNMAFTSTRDKRLPLKHGMDKLMPTQLLDKISFPFEVDSLFLHESEVEVREYSVLTNREAVIPVQHLNGVIAGIKSDPAAGDSLHVTASGTLVGNYIDRLRYSESYGDTLSYFTLHFHASPMILPHFNKATRPLAALQLNSGRSDTLYANWVGNKYAAIGKMNFYYRDLSVQLLDKHDPARKSLFLSVRNFVANTVLLRRKNYRESVVFFERDKEKFIFNYWAKTSLNGLMASIGLKRNKKYLREFESNQDRFRLPDPK